MLIQFYFKKICSCGGKFFKKTGMSLDRALNIFYHSEMYRLMREGVSDMHCMSDAYLVDELMEEYQEKM